jgi:hypothetical protein
LHVPVGNPVRSCYGDITRLANKKIQRKKTEADPIRYFQDSKFDAKLKEDVFQTTYFDEGKQNTHKYKKFAKLQNGKKIIL